MWCAKARQADGQAGNCACRPLRLQVGKQTGRRAGGVLGSVKGQRAPYALSRSVTHPPLPEY